MMNLLLLPGKNERNRQWLLEVESAVGHLFDITRRHDLAFWSDDQAEINLDEEKDKLKKEVTDFEPYCIFAKSAGSMLTCLATSDGTLRPKACLFVGFPLLMAQRFNLPVKSWLQNTKFPIVVVQNNDDPIGSAAGVREYFENTGRRDVTVYGLEGNTHDYLDLEELKRFAKTMRGQI